LTTSVAGAPGSSSPQAWAWNFSPSISMVAVSPAPRLATVPFRKFAWAQEGRSEQAAGPVIHGLRRALLLDPALVHQNDAVGEHDCLLLVMRHEDRGDAHLLQQAAQLHPHLVAQLDVEIGKRLVEQQHGRFDHDRAGDGDALLLAAGELARPSLGEAFELDQRQRTPDPLADLRRRHLPHAQAIGDVVEHAHMREQRVALEHQPDIALAGWGVGDVAAMRRCGRPGCGVPAGHG
jgi:hypothetical protein